VDQNEIPDDENGCVLKRMIASGDDITIPRRVNFSVVFPDEASARVFRELVLVMWSDVDICFSGVVGELPWDVTVSVFMEPSHRGITDVESCLGEQAAKLGGRNDGWGCFECSAETQIK